MLSFRNTTWIDDDQKLLKELAVVKDAELPEMFKVSLDINPLNLKFGPNRTEFESNLDRYNYVKNEVPDDEFWPIEENPVYFINKRGESYDSELKLLKKPYMRPYGMVYQVWGKEHIKRNQRSVSRLILNTFLPIPRCGHHEFDVIYVDNNRANYHFNNIKRHYAITQWAYKGDPEYRQLHSFPDYIIHISGKIYGLRNGIEMNTRPDINGYSSVCLLNKDREQCYPSVHRLLALSFIPLPKDARGRTISPSKLVVNHKDTDKTNNKIDLNDLFGLGTNLEWCTTSENAQHAIMNKLTSDRVPVMVRDLKTNKIYNYKTLSEAARILSTTIHNLKKHCRLEKLLRDRYKIIIKYIRPKQK